MKKDWFIPMDRIFISSEKSQPVQEEILKPPVRILKRDRPGKGVHIPIGSRKMFLHVADCFGYILVRLGMPDSGYREILWQRFAVEGIKRPALPNRLSILFEQDVMAFSLGDIEFREIESLTSLGKTLQGIPVSRGTWDSRT